MQNFQHTDMHLAWPEAIVVYVQGLPSRRDGLAGWQVEKGEDDDRDLKLVDTALASLRAKFSVDDDRIYATGFSNGANFTYLLWAERPAVFAAYAPVAARLRSSVQRGAQAAVPRRRMRDVQTPLPTRSWRSAALRGWCRRPGAPCGMGEIYGSASAAPVMT